MFFFYLTKRCLGWRNGSAVKEHLLLLQRTWVLFPASTLSSGTSTPTSGLCRQLQACGVYKQMRVNPHSTHKQINGFSKGKEMVNKLQLSWRSGRWPWPLPCSILMELLVSRQMLCLSASGDKPQSWLLLLLKLLVIRLSPGSVPHTPMSFVPQTHEKQQFLHVGRSWGQELSEVICGAFSNSWGIKFISLKSSNSI